MAKSCTKNLSASASFSLHPMTDQFIEIIHHALNETDTSNVWLETDDVTTTVRGQIVHVFDVTKAICAHASTFGKHLAFQATYSIGCPSNQEGDLLRFNEDVASNQLEESIYNPFAAAKFSLYPLGTNSYMDTILEQIEAMKSFVSVSSAPLSTKLEGNLLEIFAGLEQVFQATVDAGSNHTVMTVTFSIHSPTHQKK